jgi:ubiquinol-cytochrome c reductase cytochrome b subunit
VKRSLLDWLDNRTGYRALLHHALYEKLPAGTGWWFTLGSVLLFTLSVQLLTGILLAMFYAPTPDHAWDTVRFITTSIRGGSVLRGLHHWGASVIVVAALIHLIRVVGFGSYRKPREANWIIGLLLLQVILAFGLTGYLLPWDQRAYWATTVTVNIARLTPFAGEAMAALMRGGQEIGALTLTRWYAVHVLVLPVALFALTAAHLYLMRKHGISGPIKERKAPQFPFFPGQAARDITMAILVGVLLAVLAWKGAPALEPPADPSSGDYIPRPEWYFLGLFQLLKYFPGKLEVIGALVVPGVVMTLLAALPWLDRSATRRWRDRRMLLTAFGGGLVALITLTVLGAMDAPPAAMTAGSWTLQEQAGAMMIADGPRCARCHAADANIAAPIVAGAIRQSDNWLAAHIADPEMIAAGIRQPPATIESDNKAMLAALARLRSGPAPELPAAERQAVSLFSQHCFTCHTLDGAGGNQGPNLTGVGRKYDAASIAARVTEPLNVKPDAEMPAFGDKMTAAEINALAAWLAAHK